MLINNKAKLMALKWFRQLAEGEIDALSKIYDAFAKKIYGHSLWILRNKQDAEDILQNIFIKLAHMGAALLKIKNPSTYLFTMAHREAIGIIRQRSRKSEVESDIEIFMSDHTDSVRALEAKKLQYLISTLEIYQRETIYLHLYEDLTFREIGKIMSISTFTAASRYRLAIARLRKEFGER